MRKLSMSLLSCVLLAAMVGCTFQLKDDQQLENLTQLEESWTYIRGELAEGTIPSAELLDSHGDLLGEAKQLEESKKESWEDQARDEGWVLPGAEPPVEPPVEEPPAEEEPDEEPPVEDPEPEQPEPEQPPTEESDPS